MCIHDVNPSLDIILEQMTRSELICIAVEVFEGEMGEDAMMVMANYRHASFQKPLLPSLNELTMFPVLG